MMKRIISSNCKQVLSICFLLSFPYVVFSAERPLEEVVVTATKRGASDIQYIPFSVQAFSETKLKELSVLEFEDYFRHVPGLHVDNGGPGDKRFIVRGVNARGAAAVGVYFDEIVITGENADNGTGRQSDIKLFDVERLEVLRGPQATTYGSSSMTGTIRIIPVAPLLDEFSISGGASSSRTKESSDTSWRLDGAVNIPIVKDRLAVRLSGLKVDKAGYIDNRFAKDDNNDDTEALRGILRWQVTDDLTFQFLAMRQDQFTRARPFYNKVEAIIDTNPNFNGDPVSGFFNVNLSRAGFDDVQNLYNAKLILERDWGSITATSSRFERDSLFDRDSSVALEILSGGALAADGAGRSFISQFKERELSTHEIRFASSWDMPVQMLAGVFRQEEDRRLDTNIPVTDPVTGLKIPGGTNLFGRAHEASIDETAVFTDWTMDAGKITLSAGIRWADFDIVNQDFATVNFGGSPGPGAGPLRTTSESSVNFKFNVSYNYTNDIMAYFQATEGFRSGGANNTAAGALVGVEIPEGFNSDNLINYELGFKTSWIDGRLTANGALYYIDWSEIQTVQAARSPEGVSVPFVGNAGAADIYGFELELQALVTDNLQVNAGLNRTRARYAEDFPDPSQGLEGDKIPYVPQFTFILDARYERSLGGTGLTGFVGGDLSYTGKQNNRQRPTDPRFERISSYSIVNMRAGIYGSDWSAILSVDNVLDEDETIQFIYDFGGPPPPHNPDGHVRPWPRTASLTVRKSF